MNMPNISAVPYDRVAPGTTREMSESKPAFDDKGDITHSFESFGLPRSGDDKGDITGSVSTLIRDTGLRPVRVSCEVKTT